MTPEQRTEVLSKEKLPESIITEILSKGIKTGSRVLGGYKSGQSDIDFLLLLPDFDYALCDLEQYYVAVSQYLDRETYNILVNPGIGNEVWNLILCKTEDYLHIWETTTRCIQQLIELSPDIQEAMKERDNRVTLFKAFRKVLGDTTAEERVTPELPKLDYSFTTPDINRITDLALSDTADKGDK